MKLELTDADFEAYAPDRTRATTMTAPRSALKRRLLAWVEAVAGQLAAEDGLELEVSATDEHPSPRNGHRVDAQSVHLFRPLAARQAMHATLGTKVDESERPEVGNARIEPVSYTHLTLPTILRV